MKTVISASRRTDIPAFYLEWFTNHVKNGFIKVANPFNRKQVTKVSLLPEDVAWIVFWSRNYDVFLKNQKIFQNYRLFFHFTINPSNKILEPDMVSPQKALLQMEKMVNIFGPDVIIWRYDPLVYYQLRGIEQSNHDIRMYKEFVHRFSQMGLKKCYVSFVSHYPKVLRRIAKLNDFTLKDPLYSRKYDIINEMIEIGNASGMHIYSCSNEKLEKVPGIHKGHCINGKLLSHLGNEPVCQKLHHTRPGCGCTVSIDIGDYIQTPCRYHCLYCYAR
jgi:hypothetical protein